MNPHTDPLTRDTPAPGVVVFQPRRGYRYAMEPFLLAGWALEAGRPRHAWDLGTGCGILALLLARQGIPVSACDVRPEWTCLARRSARESGLSIDVHTADMRELPAGEADLALLNPPYHPAGRGPVSPDPSRAHARTELAGDLAALVAAGGRVARRLCVVLPRARLEEGLCAMENAGLVPGRTCELLPSLALAEGHRDPPGVPPNAPRREVVSVREPEGGWSPRVHYWYRSSGAPLRPPRSDPGPG